MAVALTQAAAVSGLLSESLSRSRPAEASHSSEPSFSPKEQLTRQQRSGKALLLRASRRASLLLNGSPLRSKRNPSAQPSRPDEDILDAGNSMLDPLALLAQAQQDLIESRREQSSRSPLISAWSAVDSVATDFAKLVFLAQAVSFPQYDWRKIGWPREPGTEEAAAIKEVGEVTREESETAVNVQYACCSWPRSTVASGARQETFPRCSWPRDGLQLSGSSSVANKVAEGPRCSWPRNAAGGAVAEPSADANVSSVEADLLEAAERQSYNNASAEDIDRLERLLAATPNALGAHCQWPRRMELGPRSAWPRAAAAPRCAWPRKALASDIVSTPASLSAVPSAEGARCSWPRGDSIVSGPRCAWPRSKSQAGPLAAAVSEISELAAPQASEPEVVIPAGPRCEWPRQTKVTANQS